MKNWIAGALLLMIFAVPSPVSADVSSPDTGEKTFLWKVQKEGTTVYLLGSVHALKGDSYPLPAVMEAAFEDAQRVMFEIDLDEMTAAAFQMLSAGTLPGGQTLEGVVGPEVWKEVIGRIESMGLQPGMFRTMKPWMAAVTLTAFEMSNAGYLSSAGLDTYFAGKAKEAGKETLALETVEFQVSLFADLTAEQSMAFLEYTLEDLETVVPELDSIAEYWRSGQVARLEELLIEGFAEFPEIFEKMVVDRNNAWLPQIEGLFFNHDNALVVVGSLHLVGDQGLVNLLRERGYTVTQM
jgi:uncharacterized protein YbaP (TraB family)